MSLVKKLVCVNCGGEFAEGQALTCPGCGMDEGILDVWFDLDRAARTLTRESLARRPRAHWRYRELLPLDDTDHPVVTGVGWTPMIEAPRLAEALEIGRLRLKDEGRSGSGSFKDRASSIGVARAMQERAAAAACASTGNAASSLAYCAAVAGLRAEIFVPHNVPEGKLAQLLAYGARVFRVGGSYAQAYDLCTRACERFGWYNRNCAVNPYLVEGKKTGGLEVAEQCAEDPPDWVVCSVGDGCSIAGVHKGLAQAQAIGIVEWRARMLGVQAEGAAPIAAAWRTGEFVRSGDGGTYADSINVPVPRNWNKALRAVRDSDGAYVTVTDAEIMAAVRHTGRLAGVFAEPAAAAAVAGIVAARRQGIVDNRSNVVAMITGNGLKDTSGALRAVSGPHDVPPDLDRVVHIVEHDAPCPPEDAG